MSKFILTQKTLQELLDYNPATGVFTWKPRNQKWFKSKRGCLQFNSRFAGSVAGCDNGSGYTIIRMFGVGFKAHRLAWMYVYGQWPKKDIDHINGNRSDNHIANLRDVNRQINTHNRKKTSGDVTSRFLGVSWYPKLSKWVAQISHGYRKICLGYYESEDVAFQAYLNAKRKLHSGYINHDCAEKK
jgi:hypothetical protein